MALTGAHAGHWMLHVSQSSFRVGAPGIHRRNLKCSLLPNGWWNKHIWLLTFFARKIWLRSHFQIYRLCDVCLIAALISVVSDFTPLFECEEAQGRHSARSSFLQPTEAGRRKGDKTSKRGSFIWTHSFLERYHKQNSNVNINANLMIIALAWSMSHLDVQLDYCWWFRTPAPVEVGSLSHYLQGFTHLVVGLGISEASAVWLWQPSPLDGRYLHHSWYWHCVTSWNSSGSAGSIGHH